MRFALVYRIIARAHASRRRLTMIGEARAGGFDCAARRVAGACRERRRGRRGFAPAALFSARLGRRAGVVATPLCVVRGALRCVATERGARAGRRRSVPKRRSVDASRDRIFLGDEMQILVARGAESRSRDDRRDANRSLERFATRRFRGPNALSRRRSPPVDWPCRRLLSSLDRRTSRACRACLSPAQPSPDWRRSPSRPRRRSRRRRSPA